MHDLESENVKQTPSNAEDIEMPALIEQRNVVNSLEGQKNSFRRLGHKVKNKRCSSGLDTK